MRTGATLTNKGSATRARIIAGAAAEIRGRGAAETTLDDVLARTRTSKSQLFHYFPDGKGQLLLEVATSEAERVLSDQQPHLGQLNSWTAWQSWRNAVVDRYRLQGRHCPLSGLLSQLGGDSPDIQAVITSLFDRWQRDITAGIREMQRQGKVGPRLDVDRTAAALLAGIQGGVVVMLTTGRLTHLEAALDVGIAHLRSSRP